MSEPVASDDPSKPLRLYRAGAAVARLLPHPVLVAMAEQLGSIGARLPSDRARALRANLEVIRPSASSDELDQLVRAGFASYGRYWAETLRMPGFSPADLEAGLRVSGYDHIRRARTAGIGPILALPHLGGWEWAAAYLGRVPRVPVSAVVEKLDPPDLFEWFVDLRSAYGVDVIPLDEHAFGRLVDAVRRRHIVTLLADRDIAGGGVEVRFFGRTVSLPAGPALLARRTGAPLHPCVVYFARSDGQPHHQGHHCVIEDPLPVAADGRLRADVQRTTQALATALERLIDAAPAQWHVLEPRFVPTATGLE